MSLQEPMSEEQLLELIEAKMEKPFPQKELMLDAIEKGDFKEAAHIIESALEEEDLDEMELYGFFADAEELEPRALLWTAPHMNDVFILEVLHGYSSNTVAEGQDMPEEFAVAKKIIDALEERGVKPSDDDEEDKA